MNEEQYWLPEDFVRRMEELLGAEWAAFRDSYEKERAQGLRINPLKTAGEEARAAVSFAWMQEAWQLEPIPWEACGFYYGREARPGKHPFHEAGLYYIQEPSAMAAAALLDPKPGERVLDLCAAPGGKSTQIAGRMKGLGLLVANEIHPARARILSQNMERIGAAGAVTVNEEPARLAACFPGFFDRILADAPCSGEGMFRKDEKTRQEWSQAHVEACAARQAQILDCAAVMLKEGGRLVYSTCTFAPEEDEGTIEAFLRRHPEFELEEAKLAAGGASFGCGVPQWTPGGRAELARTCRIWPHKTRGEGHYLAALRKTAPSRTGKETRPAYVKDRETRQLWQAFQRTILPGGSEDPCLSDGDHLVRFGDQLYRIPEEMPDCRGLKVLRPGLHLGTLKKGRLEPAHGLALYAKEGQGAEAVSLDPGGEAAARYLRGEALDRGECRLLRTGEEKGGWTLVTVDGWTLGWAKRTGNVLKNHYPKGLRQP